MITAQQKTEWLEALRSGKYKQTTFNLFSNNSFCCLGVLQALNNVEKLNFATDQWGIPETGILHKLSVLDRKHLAHMNDKERKTFPEIADWIEAHIETEG